MSVLYAFNALVLLLLSSELSPAVTNILCFAGVREGDGLPIC